MSNLDGTGPEGKGPKTGRQQGPCGKKTESTTNDILGRHKQRSANRGLGRNRRINNNKLSMEENLS